MVPFYTASALAIVLIVAGWPWIKKSVPVVKAWAAKRGVLLATGDQLMVFPTASAAPQQAIHMTLYGVEARNWFVGIFKSVTLVKEQVQPAPVKLILPG